jgi:hypothetical protein
MRTAHGTRIEIQSVISTAHTASGEKEMIKKQNHKQHKSLKMIVGTALFGMILAMSSCGGSGGAGSDALSAGQPEPQAAASAAPVLIVDENREAPMLLGDEQPMKSVSTAFADTQSAARAATPAAGANCSSPAQPGAAGGPGINDYYTPANAFDGNYRTWWAGAKNPAHWELCFGFQETYEFESININFYNSDYVPGNLFVDVSLDGSGWTRAAHVNRNSFPGAISLNSVRARFIRITMDGKPRSGFPIIREISWLPFVEKAGAFALPGANDTWYFPSNAFDGDQDTWWAGEPGAGAWDVYYNFETPRFISMATFHLFNMNYFNENMVLYVSGDGETWERAGALGPGPNTSPFNASVFVGRTVLYLHLEIRGNMPSTYPLIKDVTFGLPAGAATGDSINTWYQAANAFDGDAQTLWVGRRGTDTWNLFYTYDAPINIQNINIAYFAATHAPGETEVLVSNDAITWESVGRSSAFTIDTPVERTARYVRFIMRGNPSTDVPVLRDIRITRQ